MVDVARLVHAARIDALHGLFERRSSDARVEVRGGPVRSHRVAAAVPLAEVEVGDGGTILIVYAPWKVSGAVRGGGQSLAGHELSRRSQVVGQCIFLESLRTGTVGPTEELIDSSSLSPDILSNPTHDSPCSSAMQCLLITRYRHLLLSEGIEADCIQMKIYLFDDSQIADQ